MILADKIIRLRKKNGWSQEELAEKLNVSRQAVSKWEGAQAVPDLERILQLCSLFGVTTDYLLKDEIEIEEYCDTSDSTLRRIAIEEANVYLKQRKRASLKIALAAFLCILAPIPLIVLGVASENPLFGITETLAGVVGMLALFVLIACAVPIFVYCGFQNAPYEFLDKNEPFELGFGVRGLVEEKRRAFSDTYRFCNILAICICILSPVPLIVSAFFGNDFLCVLMLAVTMIVAGIGASIFIVVGVQNASMQKLLQKGDYTPKEKARSTVAESVGGAYWGIVVAIYLVWSFLSGDWHLTWLAFLVGGVLFPVVVAVCNALTDKKNKE